MSTVITVILLTSLTLTSTVECSRMTISPRPVYEGVPVTVRCSLSDIISHVDLLTSVTVSRRLLSNPSTDVTIASAVTLKNGGKAVLKDVNNFVSRATVTGKSDNNDKSGSFVQIQLTGMTCSDSGEYLCVISYNTLAGSPETSESSDNITILTKPGEIEMIVRKEFSPYVINETVEFRCNGNVGNPAQSWSWQLKYAADMKWMPYPYIDRINDDPPTLSGCENRGSSVLNHTVSLTDNTRMFRCIVGNNELYSANFTINTQKTNISDTSQSLNTVALGVGIGLSLIGLLALIIIILCCYFRRAKKRKKLESVPIFTGIYNTTFNSGSEETHVYSELTPASEEFPRERLRFLHLLGEGKFGKVLKAEALDIKGLKRWDEVAVKMVKETATDAEKQDFYQELLIVRKIPRHINVVAFLGCCTSGEPTLMIMEYVSGGDLLTYLRSCRPGKAETERCSVGQKDLLSFAFQTARGLCHLENNKIIHRDVAARNVLVDEGKVCKISDFGLARDVEGADVYERTSKGPLPIRWLAPESLRDKIHTHKSDVWAYGVLLWEIVTLGSSPYPGMSSKQVMCFVLDGKTQQYPPQCQEEISAVMEKCWQFEAKDRPSFSDLVHTLEQILEEDGDYIKLENMQDGIYMMLETTEEKL